MRDKKLSVIVPVYKGERFIARSLENIKTEISKYFPNYEIIAVIDGMLDKSFDEARKVPDVRVVGYKKNRGKGYALRYGYKFVTGDYVTFIDSDMDINPRMLVNFLPYLSTAEVVIGSKRHPFSKLNYPFLRRILSKGFQIYSNLILGTGLRDTQSGLKLIKREVLDVIMPSLLVKRYAFDAELCFLAKKHGFRIVEAPIYVNFKKNGSGINLKQVFRIAIDILAIRYRYSILHYYQNKFRKEKFG